MKSVKTLERTINVKLKAINLRYAIHGLRRIDGGEYWFDLQLAFNPSDMKRVNQVFEEVLKPGRESSQKRVQKKFYLREKLVEKLRLRAARTGKSQSELVEVALARAEES